MVPLLSSVATHQLPQMLRTATPASARVLSVARSIIIVYCSTLAAADDSICESTGARYGLAGMAPLLSSIANTPVVASARARRIARTASAHVQPVARSIIIGSQQRSTHAALGAAAFASSWARCRITLMAAKHT